MGHQEQAARRRIFSSASLSMPNAQCPMPNAQCPTPTNCRQLAQKPFILERSL